MVDTRVAVPSGGNLSALMRLEEIIVSSEDFQVVVALLRDNPNTPYKEIADIARISESAVRQLALEHGFQRPGKRQNELSEDVKIAVREEAQARRVHSSHLKDMAQRLRVTKPDLKRFLIAEGLLTRRKRSPNRPKLMLDELAKLRQEIGYHETELKKLRERQTQVEVRYERDGNNVIIHNLAERPVCVDYRKGLRWLSQGGGVALRDFITVNWKEVVHPKAS
jgi:hypothetical protein